MTYEPLKRKGASCNAVDKDGKYIESLHEEFTQVLRENSADDSN